MSSSDSEDENMDLFREAVDSQFINDSMFSNKKATKHNKTKNAIQENGANLTEDKPPSLRKKQDEDEQFNIFQFQITPEFQNHVAKALTKTLDKQLEKVLDTSQTSPSKVKKRKRSGVKLFKNSEVFLKIPKNDDLKDAQETAKLNEINSTRKKQRKEPQIDDEELKRIAVTSEFILNKTDVKSWSTRSKAPVFHYKKTKSKKLELVEPKIKF